MIPVEEDADQALTSTRHCLQWRCQTWEGDKIARPLLVKRGGFWCCPRCGGSYGENPHPECKLVRKSYDKSRRPRP